MKCADLCRAAGVFCCGVFCCFADLCLFRGCVFLFQNFVVGNFLLCNPGVCSVQPDFLPRRHGCGFLLPKRILTLRTDSPNKASQQARPASQQPNNPVTKQHSNQASQQASQHQANNQARNEEATKQTASNKTKKWYARKRLGDGRKSVGICQKWVFAHAAPLSVHVISCRNKTLTCKRKGGFARSEAEDASSATLRGGHCPPCLNFVSFLFVIVPFCFLLSPLLLALLVGQCVCLVSSVSFCLPLVDVSKKWSWACFVVVPPVWGGAIFVCLLLVFCWWFWLFVLLSRCSLSIWEIQSTTTDLCTPATTAAPCAKRKTSALALSQRKSSKQVALLRLFEDYHRQTPDLFLHGWSRHSC